jgi:hypothetical protein
MPMNSNEFEILCYVVGPPQTPATFTLVNSTDTSIVVECIPRYNGGHEQTFNMQYRIVNESKIWITKEIPQYNKQTYTLSELQSDTWYELRLFAENKFDKSSVTDIQSISTRPSIEKGMACRESVFCFLIFSIFYAKVGGGRYHISNHLTKITLILR